MLTVLEVVEVESRQTVQSRRTGISSITIFQRNMETEEIETTFLGIIYAETEKEREAKTQEELEEYFSCAYDCEARAEKIAETHPAMKREYWSITEA